MMTSRISNKNFTLSYSKWGEEELVAHFAIFENEVRVRVYRVGEYLNPYDYSYIGNHVLHRDQYIDIESARNVWREAIRQGWQE